jgi:ligand-binding sensor domain-containing protein
MGQAQKELSVNQAHALIDALLHAAIEDIAATIPASPADGQSWLIAAPAPAGWEGREGFLACRQGGNWLFIAPREGMSVFNKATGQAIHYDGSWRIASPPPEPTGGTTVDSEARAALLALVGALRTAGVFPGL